jgi:hypothetical protein
LSGLISRAIEFEGSGDDWAQAIVDRVKDVLPDLKIGGADVLVGVWKPPRDAKIAGSTLIAPDKTIDEYTFQGVTGLILKLGPYAYKTEKTKDWFVNSDGDPDLPRVGEWVSFNFKQGESFLIKNQPCRLVNDQYVLIRIPRPDLIA